MKSNENLPICYSSYKNNKYPENFASLVPGILKLFTREV